MNRYIYSRCSLHDVVTKHYIKPEPIFVRDLEGSLHKDCLPELALGFIADAAPRGIRE